MPVVVSLGEEAAADALFEEYLSGGDTEDFSDTEREASRCLLRFVQSTHRGTASLLAVATTASISSACWQVKFLA